MKKRELEALIREFKISSLKLARTMERLRDAKQAIEKRAQENEGEISKEGAVRHDILERLFEQSYKEIADAMNKFP